MSRIAPFCIEAGDTMTQKNRKMLQRICVAAVLLLLAYAVRAILTSRGILPEESLWFLPVFLIPYAVIGWDVVKSAVVHIFHGQVFDEKFLMTLATVGALALGEYGEAVAVMLLFQVGELIQSLAVGKSRKNIASLMDIRPDRAVVLRDGEEKSVSPEEVTVGEIVVVRPGEKIPLDGTLISGSCSVDTSSLTGESVPRQVKEGDRVVSGSVDLTGRIEVRVESVFAESTVSKILELVENASSKKSHIENFITRFARFYTPCVVFCALALAVLPPLGFGLFSGDWTQFSEWISRALLFLVVSCPCALVISVPLSFFGGIGGASKQGILVKGAEYLEALSRVDRFVFDKTGTLTRGNFKVTAIHPEHVSEGLLLDLAAAAESYSNHPIAESILAAHGGHIDKSRIGQVTDLAGRGIRAFVDGRELLVGNRALMEESGVTVPNCPHTGTVVHLCREGQYLGHIAVSDEIKPDAAEAIAALKKEGVRETVILTGDRKETADAVAKELGVDTCHAELLPTDKVKIVEDMLKSKKSEKDLLAFVGDGINDAPVLTRADVGIAMGAMGSDAAIEAADVVLMDDCPSKLPVAVRISRKTMRIAHENIVFALVIKIGVMIGSAIGLPFVNMWVAVFADVGVTILAILNAMRTLRTGKAE